VLHLVKTLGMNIKGIAHITGGGLIENVPRMLPEGLKAVIYPCNFPVSPIFTYLSSQSDIPLWDMYNTFNMGIGLVMAIDSEEIGDVMNALIQIDEHPYVIGKCTEGEKGVELKW
jgi:phosphoribosylformylglycinamidine cyclo-ligase